MQLGQVSHYDIVSAVNQLAKTTPKPSKAHMGAAKHLLCYLTWSENVSTRATTSVMVNNRFRMSL